MVSRIINKAPQIHSSGRWAFKVGVCCSLALSLPNQSFAQTDQDTASARAAATAGAQAFEAGNWQRSIDYFERAEALVHSPVHLWYLASASAKLGKLVSAQEKCTKVQREEAASNASSGVVRAHNGCEELLEDLEGRVPALTLEVQGLSDGANIRLSRNGAAVPAATIGVPVPLDPGNYNFEGLADGFRAKASVVLAEGQKRTLALVFEPDASARVSPPAPQPANGVASAPAATQPEAPYRSGKGGPPIGSYLSWVVGAGGIGVGVGFTMMGLETGKKIDDKCGGDRDDCRAGSPEDQVAITSLVGNEQTYYVISGIGYGVGGAAILTGFLLWAFKPDPRPSSASGVHVTPVIGYQHVGLAGTF